MTRPLLAIVLISLPLAASADGAVPAAPPAPAQTPVAATSRATYDVPPERVNPVADQRANAGTNVEKKRRSDAIEADVRARMSYFGFSDVAVQDAIIAHQKEDIMARGPLREQSRRLFRGLNSPKVNDAEMSLALGGYMAAMEADRARRIVSEEALDAKIGYSKNPRLRAMLLLFGFIGDSPVRMPLRSFNQPPKALPRPDDKTAYDPGPPPAPAPVAVPAPVPVAAPVPAPAPPQAVVPVVAPAPADAPTGDADTTEVVVADQ